MVRATLLRLLALVLAATWVPGCGAGSSILTDPPVIEEDPPADPDPDPPAEDPPAEDPPADPPPAPSPDPDGPTLDPGFNPSTNLIEFFHDSAKTDDENGKALEAALESLQAGDLLRIHEGHYAINTGRLGIRALGTEANPITIEAAEGELVVISRDNLSENIVNIDEAYYLTIKGIEIDGKTTGGQGIKIYDAHHVFIYNCHVHHIAGTAIAANVRNTHHLYFVDNHIHHTTSHGEGFYLGHHDGVYVTHDTYVVGNYIHDTKASDQGDGVEIKKGSYGCVVSDNLIVDTLYPGVILYDTQGHSDRPNIVERNIIINATDGSIQVSGDAIIRNNLVIGGGNGALMSWPNNGALSNNLTIVNNTFLNATYGIRTNQWNTSSNIVVANNAIYSASGQYLTGNTGGGGVTLSSNVELTGLSAFVNVTMDGVNRDATPSAGSPLIGAGNADYEPVDDLNGKTRTGTVDAGAVDPD